MDNNSKIFGVDGKSISKAAEIIKRGGLVAFPTETVYGLGANALDGAAVLKIFEAKGRPSNNPLILHVSDMREASLYAAMNPVAESLMEHFWPGPLTIVLHSLGNVPLSARGGLDTVALRAPMNQTALALIKKSGVPIAAPSANRSGRPSPTDAKTVADDLGDAVSMIIDGGSTAIGVESTVVDATGNGIAILRPGGITQEMLSEIARIVPETEKTRRRSPGVRYRHYAPSIELRLWDGKDHTIFPGAGSWCYAGMKNPPKGYVKKIIFATPGEYARGLFSALRELEVCGASVIIADLPYGGGIKEAIRDRLTRAAGTVY